ncbi:MAG: tyrosine-type recombinase/integrase [Solirubrobacteraceae bacterium]
MRALIGVLWRGGLRISEALALNETDIDDQRGALLIRHGKGDKRREAGMDPFGFEQLAAWLTHRVVLPPGPLFCVIDGQTRGRRWSATGGRGELRRLALEAGVRRRFAPHQLRHAHAVELAREGVAVNIIQRQLGHTDLGTTSTYLQGIDPSEIIDAVRSRRQPTISAPRTHPLARRPRRLAARRRPRAAVSTRLPGLPLCTPSARMQQRAARRSIGDKGGVSFGTSSPRGGLRPHRRPPLLRLAPKGARSSRIGCVPRAWARGGVDTAQSVGVLAPPPPATIHQPIQPGAGKPIALCALSPPTPRDPQRCEYCSQPKPWPARPTFATPARSRSGDAATAS